MPPGRFARDNRDAPLTLQAKCAGCRDRPSNTPEPAETRRDSGIELEKEDDGNGKIGRDEGEQEAGRVEELEDDDPAPGRARHVLSHRVLEEAGTRGVG